MKNNLLSFSRGESRIPMDPADLTEARVAEMVSGVAAYLHRERELYFRASEPLSPGWRNGVQAYFPNTLLDSIRTIILQRGAHSAAAFLFRGRGHELGKFPRFRAPGFLHICGHHRCSRRNSAANTFSWAGSCHPDGSSRTRSLHGSLRSRFREVAFLDCDSTRSTGLPVGHPFCHVSIDELLRGGGGEVLGRTRPVLTGASFCSLRFGTRSLEGPECLWGGTRGGGSEEETRQTRGSATTSKIVRLAGRASLVPRT